VDALTERWAISWVSALELIVGAQDKRDLTQHRYFSIGIRDRVVSKYPGALKKE